MNYVAISWRVTFVCQKLLAERRNLLPNYPINNQPLTNFPATKKYNTGKTAEYDFHKLSGGTIHKRHKTEVFYQCDIGL